MKRERNGNVGMTVGINNRNRRKLVNKEDMNKRWAEYFEND